MATSPSSHRRGAVAAKGFCTLGLGRDTVRRDDTSRRRDTSRRDDTSWRDGKTEKADKGNTYVM